MGAIVNNLIEDIFFKDPTRANKEGHAEGHKTKH